MANEAPKAGGQDTGSTSSSAAASGEPKGTTPVAKPAGDSTASKTAETILGGEPAGKADTSAKAQPATDKQPAASTAKDGKEAKQQSADAEGKSIEDSEGGEPKGQETTTADFVATLPEGVEASEALLKPFAEVVKEHGVPHEVAQKFVDLYVDAQTQAAEAAAQQDLDEWKAQQSRWVEEVKTDKELGGTNFEATQTAIRTFFGKYADAETREFFNATGLGNHPKLVRLFARVAKADSEDSLGGAARTSGSAQPSEAEMLARMYPTMSKQQS